MFNLWGCWIKSCCRCLLLPNGTKIDHVTESQVHFSTSYLVLLVAFLRKERFRICFIWEYEDINLNWTLIERKLPSGLMESLKGQDEILNKELNQEWQYQQSWYSDMCWLLHLFHLLSAILVNYHHIGHFIFSTTE